MLALSSFRYSGLHGKEIYSDFMETPQLRTLKRPPFGGLFRPHEDGIAKRYNILMYYVYILQSAKRKNWLYKGSTSDLKRRVQEHNSGKNFSTAPYTPFKLIYYESYLLKSDAEARERYLKTSMGIRVIKKQLANYLKQN